MSNCSTPRDAPDRNGRLADDITSFRTPPPTSYYSATDGEAASLIPRSASNLGDNATECFLCGALFGKRRLKPRHHCRVCWQPVCAACSPNQIHKQGESGLQRVCVACGANALKAPALKSRLERVADAISAVSGASSPDFTFAEAICENREAHMPPSSQSKTLDDIVTSCEVASQSLMSAFHSHQGTKQKIAQVEADAREQRQAAQRLRTVADRVEEAETEAAEERQARKQLEAKVRLAKLDNVRLAERLCALTGTQVSCSRSASLEDAVACCDSAIVRLEAFFEEERRARKELETEKQEAAMSRERTVASLQAEIMKLRAQTSQERKLRESLEDSMLQSVSSRNKTSLSPRNSVLAESEGDRLIFPSSTASLPGVRTPPRMDSVHEDLPSCPGSVAPSSCETPGRTPCKLRVEGCQSKCTLM